MPYGSFYVSTSYFLKQIVQKYIWTDRNFANDVDKNTRRSCSSRVQIKRLTVFNSIIYICLLKVKV